MNALTIKALAVICAAYTAGVVTPAVVKHARPKPRPAATRPAVKPQPPLQREREVPSIIACLPTQQIGILPPVALPSFAEKPAPRWRLQHIGDDLVPLGPVAGGIPEPESWAMLIAGLGLVGGVARRRRLA